MSERRTFQTSLKVLGSPHRPLPLRHVSQASSVQAFHERRLPNEPHPHPISDQSHDAFAERRDQSRAPKPGLREENSASFSILALTPTFSHNVLEQTYPDRLRFHETSLIYVGGIP